MKEIQGVKLYDVKDLRIILGLSELTIRHYLKTGKIIGQKIGAKYYVSQDNLHRFINPGNNPDISTMNESPIEASSKKKRPAGRISINRKISDFERDVNKVIAENPKYETVRSRFIEYWTEQNKSGTRIRYEDQKYFDISKRLGTFLHNYLNYNGHQ